MAKRYVPDLQQRREAEEAARLQFDALGRVLVPGARVEMGASPALGVLQGAGRAGALLSTPTGNTGVKETNGGSQGGSTETEERDDLSEISLVLSNGKTKIHLQRTRSGDGSPVIHDWVNFTISEPTIMRISGNRCLADEDFVIWMGAELGRIFGFRVTGERKNGANFYKRSWNIGDDFGLLCFTGRDDTMLISLSGAGCQHALPGWESRLYDFLTDVRAHGERAVITRVDLARDFLNGEYPIEYWRAMYDYGQFVNRESHLSSREMWPTREYRGCWETEKGSKRGRTMYVGRRISGLFFRCYEKGKKEGAPDSPWVRAELEIKSVDRIIPLEVLLTPAVYWGQYPVLRRLSTVQPERIVIQKKLVELTAEHSIRIIKEQYGKHLRVMHNLLDGDSSMLLDQLMHDDVDAMPRRWASVGASVDTQGPSCYADSSNPLFEHRYLAAEKYRISGNSV